MHSLPGLNCIWAACRDFITFSNISFYRPIDSINPNDSAMDGCVCLSLTEFHPGRNHFSLFPLRSESNVDNGTVITQTTAVRMFGSFRCCCLCWRRLYVHYTVTQWFLIIQPPRGPQKMFKRWAARAAVVHRSSTEDPRDMFISSRSSVTMQLLTMWGW